MNFFLNVFCFGCLLVVVSLIVSFLLLFVQVVILICDNGVLVGDNQNLQIVGFNGLVLLQDV